MTATICFDHFGDTAIDPTIADPVGVVVAALRRHGIDAVRSDSANRGSLPQGDAEFDAAWGNALALITVPA